MWKWLVEFSFVASLLWLQPTLVAAEVLATFDGNIQGWEGYGVEVTAVPTPSADARGALRVEVALSGRGWSDVTAESPELNRDFSQIGELRAQVYAPAGMPDVRAQLFVKSGSNWTKSEGDLVPLSVGQWKVITIPRQRIAEPTNVRTVGVKIGGTSKFNGPVYIDLVETTDSATGAGSAATVVPQQITIGISEIQENSHIRGRVYGIPPDQVGNYRVLVYVQTDRWYIHPYERGDDGLSFASIKPDGSWQIQTVKRQFKADNVAALVVRSSDKPRAILNDPSELRPLAVTIEAGGGRL